MALKFDADYLSLAIEDKQLPNKMNIKFIRRDIGKIKIISGQLIACDPGVMEFGVTAFSQTIPVGEYPVKITIVDDCITFATIHLTDSKPICWDLMLLPEQDLSQLDDKEFFGYGVDTGIGCFADLHVAEFIKTWKLGKETFNKLLNDMRSSDKDMESWSSVDVKDGNIVAFSSGWCDGSYPTFAGFDKDDKLAVVVTDFMCIYDKYYNRENDEIDDE